MSLSPELRNRIYALALRPQTDGEGGIPGTRAILLTTARRTGTTHYFQYSKVSSAPPPPKPALLSPWAQQPALTQISKVIRSETLPVYYGANLFVIFVTCCNLTHRARAWATYGAELWAHTVGASNVVLLRNVEICFNEAVYGNLRPCSRWYSFLEEIRQGPLSRLFNEQLQPKFMGLCYFNNANGNVSDDEYWVPLHDIDCGDPSKGVNLSSFGPVEEDSMAFRRKLYQ